jgi:citrate lyase beta subunit
MHKVQSASKLSADVIALDLEDAVHPSRKEEARDNLMHILNTFSFDPRHIVVRINPLSSKWGMNDLKSIQSHPKIHAICLPKVEGLAEIALVSEAVPDKGIWLCCETAQGIYYIRNYVHCHDNANALIFGNNDFSAELGIATTDHLGLQQARAEVVLAARANGMMVFDGPSRDLIQDLAADEEFKEECQQARRLGFDGKLVIHPSQIGTANKAFSPTPKEVEEAKAMIDASEDASKKGYAAFKHNGKLVEALHVKTAHDTILIAKQIEAFCRTSQPFAPL